MAANLVLDLNQLNNKLLKDGEKHQLVNTITKQFKANKYSKAEICEFLNPRKIGIYEKFFKRLYINILIETKNDDILIQSLLSEDEEIIDTIIKRCDFFWGNPNYSIKFLNEKIFPQISYSQRKEILKAVQRNIKDPEYSKNCFDQLNTIYGIETARPFLKFCTLDVWIETLNRNVFLNEKDLLDIIRTRPKDVLHYIEALVELHKKEKLPNNCSLNDYLNIFLKLLDLYPQDAFKLIDRKKGVLSSFKASRKLTKKLIKLFSDFVLADAESDRYNQFIIMKYLTKEQLEIYLSELFPKNNPNSVCIPEINYQVSCYIDKIKSNKVKLDIIQKCYKRVYGKELLANKNNINLELLKWMEDNDLRHMYAMEKFENTVNSDENVKPSEWIPFMKTDVSIPKLKELIQTSTNATDRKEFLKNLIFTCVINKDSKALIETLKYVNTKFKNEQISVRNNCISILGFGLEKNLITYNPEHWEEIYNMIYNFDLKSELNGYTANIPNIIFTEALKYSSKDKTLFKNWFRLFCQQAYYQEAFNEILKTKSKKILELASECIDEKSSEFLLGCYHTYNKDHPKDTLNIFGYEFALQCCKRKIKDKEENNLYLLSELIDFLEKDRNIAKYFNNEITTLKKEYITSVNDVGCFPNFAKYAKCHSDYIPMIAPKICDVYINFLKQRHNSFCVKMYWYQYIKKVPELETAFHKKLYEILKNKETDELKEYAIWILSSHLTNDEFFEIVKPYYPKEKAPNTESDECQYKFMYQKRIAYSLKRFKSDPETLNALKAFCYGDYLQWTVGSLNSICKKIPYYKSKEFLEKCINAPVSFRKHVFRLLYTILNKNSSVILTNENWTKEKNPTTRKILLQTILKYFMNDFDKLTWWNILENCINQLSSKDKDMIEILANTNNIPFDYLSQYVELIYKKILKIENEVPDLQKTRFKMLHNINFKINYMSKDFIEDLLRENFLNIKLHQSVCSNYSIIAASYLFSNKTSKSDVEERIKLIFEKIKLAFKNWNSYDENNNVYFVRELIFDFINEVIRKILNLDIEDKDYINFMILNFVKSLKEIFDPSIYLYSYYIHFELILIYFDVDKNLLEFGKQIRDIIDREIQRYGTISIFQLTKEFQRFYELLEIDDDNENNITDIIDGLLYEPLPFCECALVVHFLLNVQNAVKDSDIKRKYNEKLLETEEKRIRLYLNSN
ncbi:uncharacterized protein LOC129611344 [Condylostylus longicornis]|uniref:uncharacterized protein LOC129611344 n=1 Tax=Condylostylus longicornis TaxID=2530218 RepID=UPI00244E4A26|nr:uncharacterized protein LOC129611344 [Condylostylus longicornis]XP_055380412.1 uncharacterized protein LOC129611344 [Condylostylus longicornis]